MTDMTTTHPTQASVPVLTKEQAAIVGCFTGVSAGPFSDVHELAEKLLGRPIWTHEFASSETWEELKAAAKPLFLEICVPNEANHD